MSLVVSPTVVTSSVTTLVASGVVTSVVDSVVNFGFASSGVTTVVTTSGIDGIAVVTFVVGADVTASVLSSVAA